MAKATPLVLRIEGDANLKGADRLVILIDQPAIQPVMQFNRTSNVEFKLTDEIPAHQLDSRILCKSRQARKTGLKSFNNQAIFGAWGPVPMAVGAKFIFA